MRVPVAIVDASPDRSKILRMLRNSWMWAALALALAATGIAFLVRRRATAGTMEMPPGRADVSDSPCRAKAETDCSAPCNETVSRSNATDTCRADHGRSAVAIAQTRPQAGSSASLRSETGLVGELNPCPSLGPGLAAEVDAVDHTTLGEAQAEVSELTAPVPGGVTESEGQPVLSVRCFGPFKVLCGERELSPIGPAGVGYEYHHYKAWEVLAYLAAQPDGAVAKERMFADIWPNTDRAKAAVRLKNALSRLRTLLARQVPGLPATIVRSERGGVCHLDTSLVRSDVHEFMALCQAAPKQPRPEAIAAYEQARALYRDDLLDRPFYEWAYRQDDGRPPLRERLAEEHRQATNNLARLYREQGEPSRAARLYERLLKSEPALEELGDLLVPPGPFEHSAA